MIERICQNCVNFISGWGITKASKKVDKTKRKPKDKRGDLVQGRCGLDNLPTGVNWSCGKFQPIVIETEGEATSTKKTSSLAA